MKAHELARRLLEMPDLPVEAQVSEAAYEITAVEVGRRSAWGADVIELDGNRSW